MSKSVAQSRGGSKAQVRNRILSITRNMIPYVKELRRLPLVKSVTASVLMQQLDYWFERYPDEFWKFLSPCEHAAYKPGNSWTEELGMSEDEFRTAFDQIGIRYKSKKEYSAAADKFQGKYYCSYTDKVARMTYYRRNHQMVDAELDRLVSMGGPVAAPYSSATPIYRSGQGQPVESGEGKPHYKETNKETNQENIEESGIADAIAHSHDISKFEGTEDGRVVEGYTTFSSDGFEDSDAAAGIIDAEPVFDSGPSAPADEDFPPDCQVTEVMQAWADENLPAGIDVDFATRKFFDFHRAEKRNFRTWKLWMRNERPSTGGCAPRRATDWFEEQLRREANIDLFADVTD